MVEAARNVLLLDPDYGPARERLAEALAAKGDWKAALEYWIAADDDESETID